MPISGRSGCLDCSMYVNNAPADAEAAFDQLDQQLGDSDSMWVGDLKVERDVSWGGSATITVSKMYASPVSYDESRDIPLFKFSKDDNWFWSDEYSAEYCFDLKLWPGENFCRPVSVSSYMSDDLLSESLLYFWDYAKLFGLEIKDSSRI